jgi:hypothetical protein
VLHCATDWHDYAEQMLAVLSAEPGLARQESLRGPRRTPGPRRLGPGLHAPLNLRLRSSSSPTRCRPCPAPRGRTRCGTRRTP